MPTHMHALDRHLITIERELLKGELADITVIQDASAKFHIIMPRVNWQAGNLAFKGQFMSRWFDLDDKRKALHLALSDGHSSAAPIGAKKIPSKLITAEQMQLAI